MKRISGLIFSLWIVSLPLCAQDWTREAKDRTKRTALHDSAQLVRGDSGKWNDDPRVQHAPPIAQKPTKMPLDAWADQLRKQKLELTDQDDNWLLFQSEQLDDNDRVWVERIERRGQQLTVVANLARWQGKYFRNFTYFQVIGLNLGKLEPGKYEVKWILQPLVFTKFDGDGKPLPENWPQDEKPAPRKPTELRVTFTVSKGARGALPAPAPDQVRGKRLFEGQCSRCHGIQGGGGTGANLQRPRLRHAPDDESLFNVIRKGIPGTGMPTTFAMTDNEVRDVTAYVRSLGRIPSEPLPGDPDRGRIIYHKAECATCHIVAGKGGNLGPELSDIGDRRGLAFLRGAMLHPGKDRAVTAEGYATFLPILAATRDGRVLTGIRVNEDTFTIQLRDTNNRLYSLQKSDLEELRPLEGSVMPAYEKMLSPSDIDHVVSYLASLKGTP